jgi:hypothetical protein
MALLALTSLVRPVDGASLRHATWSCGSVLRPHRFPVLPLGELGEAALDDLVAGQAACAEARDARVADALRAGSLSVALAAPALAFTARRPRRDEDEDEDERDHITA